MRDPRELFPGTIAIVAPHPDDETLGCGGLIARLAGERESQVVFATDGSRSPSPSGGAANPSLVDIREREAIEALALLGVPGTRVRFLRFPDGDLSNHDADFRRAITEALIAVSPATILVPFRYDWHPDHMAAFRATASASAQHSVPGKLVEYFVYTQRRLLPGGDVRSCFTPTSIWQVETASVATAKRGALECHRSQTARIFDWQERPILTPDVLTRSCQSPEVFLPTTATLPTRRLVPPWWIGMATRLEPPIKRTKDRLHAWMSS
jgi:LmbE family N-acetylglucosaminyl deacetylase